jgi:DNA replication factor GINS
LDEFFQVLREIQKKERSLSGLSSIGDNFYDEVSNYLNLLMKKIDDNPFSFESYLLRDAQRIVEEICERREHKIASSAVMNVQRGHQLFKESNGKKRVKENPIAVPMNSTSEEENLYYGMVDSIIKYRKNMAAPLKSYIQKNHGNLIESPVKASATVITDKVITGKPVSTEKSVEIEPVSTETVAKPVEIEPVSTKPVASETASNIPVSDISTKAPKSKKSFEDEAVAGFENQIYEIYGSEPSKRDSGVKETLKSQESSEDSSPEGSISEVTTVGVTKFASVDESPVKAVHTKKSSIETLMMLDELPSIVGVDKNVYGPVSPQDIITIPEPNARILIKNKKGRSIQTYK